MNKKIRIEIHLQNNEVKILDKLANFNLRSRKNFCETEILKCIKTFEDERKKSKT
jgi:hypothetical protein